MKLIPASVKRGERLNAMQSSIVETLGKEGQSQFVEKELGKEGQSHFVEKELRKEDRSHVFKKNAEKAGVFSTKRPVGEFKKILGARRGNRICAEICYSLTILENG